jgi:hypothetical protein
VPVFNFNKNININKGDYQMKKILLALMVSAIYINAFADDMPVVIRPKPTEEISSGSSSSADNRKNKSHLLTAQPVGFGPSRGYDTFAATYGQYIDSDSLITFDFTKGRANITWFSDENITTSSIGISYKHFTSNSFYFKAGADYRTVDYLVRDYFTVFSSTTNTEQKFKGESLVASLSIGNQWQFESFTLGCDWVGYSVPLYSKVHDVVVLGTPTTSEISRFNDDQDYYTKDSAFSTLVRFYLGASF